MGDDKEAAPPASKATGSVLTRAMTSPAMTSPSLTTSLNKIPFKLLELKVISAHDLPPVSKYLHTYVMAWVHPDNKMITPVDHKGNTNPTWNYRMVFGVDDKFLNSKSSAVMVEIYNISKLSNRPIGTTSLPVEILLNNSHSEIMKKPLKLQISRPSGDPQGCLIVSVNLVTTTIRNLNEETENSPRTIMIRQISQRLSHSESAKRVTYCQDEEEHDDGDGDGTTSSDPESGSIDLEIKSLASDVSSAVKDSGSGMYSPIVIGENSPTGIGENDAGPGTSEFDKYADPGTSEFDKYAGPGTSEFTSEFDKYAGPGTSSEFDKYASPGTSEFDKYASPGTSEFDKWSEAGEEKLQNTNVKENDVVKLQDDKVVVVKGKGKGKEQKVWSRHRRHSDGGGFLSFFTTAIICGSGSMGNKHQNRKMRKKSKSTKKGHGNAMDYPADLKKLPHDI